MKHKQLIFACYDLLMPSIHPYLDCKKFNGFRCLSYLHALVADMVLVRLKEPRLPWVGPEVSVILELVKHTRGNLRSCACTGMTLLPSDT